MSSRWTGFFIWALVAASSAFWALKIFAATRPVPVSAQAPAAAVPPAGPMERLFGAVVVAPPPTEAPHPESERFQLVGVIAPGAKGEGIAIVAIDGQPAKPWHVGATLDGNTTLQSVAKRSADFGPAGGPAAFTLQLPEPAAPETGTLPTATSQPDPSTAPPPQPMPSTSRANADHVAQPGVPGMQRIPGGRGFQRGGFVPGGRGGAAVNPPPLQGDGQPQGEGGNKD